MARIHALPSLEVIRGLKGIIDFYLWKGLPCARAWPRWRPARQSEASKAAALFFGAVVKSYSLLGELPLAAYREDAAGQPRSARDVFVSSIYGNLHEADVSDFLGLLIECRDFLSALTTILNALQSNDTDQLVANVAQSALPTGAATAAIQTTQLTALQNLAALQDALQSKALDRLLVRGEDQLLSFKDVLALEVNAPLEGTHGYIDSPPIPEGQIWHITNIAARDATGLTTQHAPILIQGTDTIELGAEARDFETWSASRWTGNVFGVYPGHVRVRIDGGQDQDNCYLWICGRRITLET